MLCGWNAKYSYHLIFCSSIVVVINVFCACNSNIGVGFVLCTLKNNSNNNIIKSYLTSNVPMDNVKNELAEDNSSMYKFIVSFFKTFSSFPLCVLKYLVF